MCYTRYKTLEETNKNFEERMREIDETKFFNLINNTTNYNNKNHIDKIDIESLNNAWINQDGPSKSREDTKESYYRKILSNSWDFVIDWSISIGNQHFAITINMPLEFWYDGVHLWNYDNFKLEEYIKFEINLKNHILNGFKTTTFIFIVPERNKQGVLHFHILISIRNFIDYNYTLRNNLLLWLKGFNSGSFFMNDFDIKVESLLYFKDVKNWAIYMYKDMYNWKFTSKIYILTSYCYEFLNKYLGNVTFYFLQINCEFILIEREDYKYLNNLNGIKITNNKIEQTTLTDLLQYYLILNEYYIYNDNIYKKIKYSKISYKLIGNIKETLYDKFQENVVSFFINNFEYYFKGFDFNYLLKNYFIKTKHVIEAIRDISTQRIEPDFGLIEFTDGVYSIKYDRFFPNNYNYLFNNKISTIKYYNKSYGWIRQNKPKNWISSLKNALGIFNKEMSNEDYIRLCLHIINPIHKNIFDKQATLFIHGQSNTGKTTLIANILSEYYGSDNIGSIISAKNFKWQDLIGKKLGIIDEGRYNSSMSSDLLKITGQEKIIVEKKYSKEHISIDPIPLIILTNTLFEDKNKSIDEALKNRLYMIEFINTISKDNLNDSKEFRLKLREEEANIIIYCNKLLFKLREGSLKKIGDRISNKKVIEMLEYKK